MTLSQFFIVSATGLALAVPCCAQTLKSETRLAVPTQQEGWAEIPLFNGFPMNRLLTEKKANLKVQHDKSSIIFDISMPVPEGYVAPAPTERDALEILQKSGLRLEVLLQPAKTGPYYYYAVNSAGAVYDARGTDKSWDGHAQVTTTLEKSNWHASLRIPYSDIGLDPNADPRLGTGILVENKSEQDKFVVTWTAVGADMTNPKLFGTLELGERKPFVSSAQLSPVQYTATGAKMGADFTVVNPADKAVTYGEGTSRVGIPAGGTGTVNQTIPLHSAKLSDVTFTLADTFNYHHQAQNLLMPDIELLAQDLTRFRLHIRNKTFLSQYVSTVKVEIDGKELYNAPLAGIEKYDFPIKGLSKGNHKLTAVLYSPAKSEISNASIPFYVYDPPKIDDPISAFDFSRYYKPINYAQGQMKTALSQFDLSRGALPRQIAVNGMPILAAPIAIRFNGQQLVEKQQTRITSQNKNRFSLVSNGTIGNTRANIQAHYDYDGFTWYDVTLRGNAPLKYGPLDIVIPLKLAKDILLTRTSRMYDEQFTKSGYTESRFEQKFQGISELLKDAVSEYPMSSVLSIATDDNEQYRGLSFITEGPRDWNLKSYDRMFKIERDNAGNATLTIHVSDGAVAWERNEIKFSFGVQPFPMRTYPNDARRTNRLENTFDPTNYKASYEEQKRKGEETFFQRLAKSGAKTEVAFEYWTEHENYWKTTLRDEDMKAYVQDAHENKMEVIPYFGFLISDTIPEFPLYHDLALVKPTPYPDKPGFDYYGFYKFGDPKQQAYPVCYNSFWRDTLAKGMEEAVDRYKFDGVYLDGTYSTAVCENHQHGCGVIDPYGRHVPTAAIRATRRLAELVFRMGEKRSRNFKIDLHIGDPCPPFMGLLSGYYTGESMHLFDPKYNRMDEGALRGLLNGKLYGVPADLLLRPPYFQDTGWAQALSVDGHIRLAMGGGEKWVSLAQRMWNLDKTYGTTADRFTPYFSARNKIKTNNEKVLVGYYDTPKALIVVVSNYLEEADQKITLDLDAFPALKNAQATDIWHGDEKLQIADGKLTATVPGLNLRLLVVEK
jgi:hypothetical protein